MTRRSAVAVTPGSPNILEDIGFSEPEEESAKVKLAGRIQDIVRERQLTQTAAALAMGIDQPKVSALLNGRLANFSSGRLMRLLTALGQDVEIVLKTKPRGRPRGRIRVVETNT